jgi:hypothetical protein
MTQRGSNPRPCGLAPEASAVDHSAKLSCCQCGSSQQLAPLRGAQKVKFCFGPPRHVRRRSPPCSPVPCASAPTVSPFASAPIIAHELRGRAAPWRGAPRREFPAGHPIGGPGGGRPGGVPGERGSVDATRHEDEKMGEPPPCRCQRRPAWHPRRGKCFMMSPRNGMPWPRSRRCGVRRCRIQYATATKFTRRRRPWNSSPCEGPPSARSANVPSARGVTTVAIGARWPSENPFPGALRVGIRLGKSATGPSACPAGWCRPISSAVACLFSARPFG